MKVQLQQEVWEVENDPKNIQMILQSIDEVLSKGDWQLSHLLIDGEAVYGNFVEYISEHIAEIEKIEVITLRIWEIVQGTILSTGQYLKKVVPILNELSDEFYQRPDNSSWTGLTNLVEGLQWIIQTMAQIDSLPNLSSVVKNHEIWNEYVQAAVFLNKIIPELGEAIGNRDTVLIGDILLYEISPTFTEMLKKIEKLVPAVVEE